VIFNARKYIESVFDAIFAQTYQTLEVIAVINGDNDGSEDLIRKNYPAVLVLNPNENLWFSRGNNLAILKCQGDLIQLVNQDLILTPTYIQILAEAMQQNQFAAAGSGKLLRFDFQKNEKTDIIDSTGIEMSVSGRARDRGQHQLDRGQFDSGGEVFAVSGAGPMYLRRALEKVKYCDNGRCEYFDEDFTAYWEDVDLSWRLSNAGYKNIYVPEAVAFHGRTAGQARGGYLHLVNFIIHHRKIPRIIRCLNYKNHIFMYLKNSKRIHPLFIIREIFMLGYIILFEPSTLKIVPQMARQLPKILKKRKQTKTFSTSAP
jgi:GT2 family glycosyltransferase